MKGRIANNGFVPDIRGIDLEEVIPLDSEENCEKAAALDILRLQHQNALDEEKIIREKWLNEGIVEFEEIDLTKPEIEHTKAKLDKFGKNFGGDIQAAWTKVHTAPEPCEMSAFFWFVLMFVHISS